MLLTMPLKLEKKNGIKENNEQIVKEMLKKNLPVELICEITKLTKVEVEKIKKTNNNTKN